MSERRHIHATSVRVAGSFILGASGVVVTLAERDWQMLPMHPMWSWISGALLLGYFGMALYAFFGPIRCRKCGSIIPRNAPSEGESFRYHCARCDIDWETGWRVPRDLTS